MQRGQPTIKRIRSNNGIKKIILNQYPVHRVLVFNLIFANFLTVTYFAQLVLDSLAINDSLTRMSQKMNFTWDLKLLLTCILVLVSVWLLIIQWDFGSLVAGSDGTAFFLYIRDLVNVKGDWHSLFYHLQSVGGMREFDTFGAVPFLTFLCKLDLSPLVVTNLYFLTLQLLLGFILSKIAFDLRVLWIQKSASFSSSWLEMVPIAVLCEFSPALAWRIGYGHHMFLAAMGAFLSVIAIYIGTLNRSLSVISAMTCFLAATFSFSVLGQQILIYSFIFGLPLSITIFFLYPSKKEGKFTSARFRLQSAGFSITLVMLAFLVTLPQFYCIFQWARSSDASRDKSVQNLVYSYLKATPWDWISSIPWSLEVAPPKRNFFQWHEVNFGFGPFLALWLITAFRYKKFLIAWIFVFLLPILYSLDFHLISDFLIKFIPYFNSFRVPERAILPFAILLPAISISLFLNLSNTVRKPTLEKRNFMLIYSVFLTLSVFSIICGQPLRELLTWALVISSIFLLPKLGGWQSRVSIITILFICAANSVFAFKQRLPKTADILSLEPGRKSILKSILKTAPELSEPINRVKLDFAIDHFGLNTGNYIGLSTIEGYWNPPKRFLLLGSALYGKEFNPTMNTIQIQANTEPFRVLSLLYNLRYTISLKNGTLELKKLEEPLGKAWFSTQLDSAKNIKEIAAALLEKRRKKISMAGSIIYSLDENYMKEVIEFQPNPVCSEAKIIEVKSLSVRDELLILVNTNATCPLVASMNFADNLRATIKLKDGSIVEKKIFPAYGSLAGIVVPAGTLEIHFFSQESIPKWIEALSKFADFGFIPISIWAALST